MDLVDLKQRRIIVGWSALGLGSTSFFLLVLTRDMSLALQFSLGIAILTSICFRWWTNPVHSGIFGYLSPHTIILVHSFFYFGLGSLPRLAFPETEIIGYYNIGVDDYFLPMLMLGLSGLLVFDLVYRKMTRAVSLNRSLESGFNRFSSPEIQVFLPVIALVWYSICIVVFIYMSRSYIMNINFRGVEGSLDNIFLQGGFSLLSTAWIVMSLLLFKPGFRFFRIIILAMIIFLLPVMFAYQNRRIVIYCLTVTVLSYFVYTQRGVKFKVLIWSVLLILAAFVLMTSVRYVASTDPSTKRYVSEDKDFLRRTVEIISSPKFMDLEPMNAAIKSVVFKRLNGLDWAAAIMAGRANTGVPFLWGKHNLPTAATIIPRVIWPGKPTPMVEKMVNQHFELADFDQLGSILGSAYADGGVVGVILGFGFLGFIFPPALKFIFRRKDGVIVYLGAMTPLLAYENFVLKYPLQWFRWVLILMVINSVVLFVFTSMRSRREAVEI